MIASTLLLLTVIGLLICSPYARFRARRHARLGDPALSGRRRGGPAPEESQRLGAPGADLPRQSHIDPWMLVAQGFRARLK